ncbi:lipase family protein [Paraburkholderia lycopersici]|uniref:Secretory lipase n=1 Tax=Paraburkholderia lycopersici TaxID=416944 RepID=A0A1G6MNJ1_9BURK|nr:lipase family protein [Paraburkholderia lycopersici]SDC57041.1 Secretory lipase [Paraburkholderia lycopersici]
MSVTKITRQCATYGRRAAMVATIVSLASGAHAHARHDIPPFYTAAPQAISGLPGTLIRRETWTGKTPPHTHAWRILYRSTGLHGEPIAVSAVVAAPDGPAAAGGRPVVAWQHPTTGVVQACAPSLTPDALHTIMGLAAMLRRGYVVVATDYPGLGTPGPHPYLVVRSEGRAVLDAVRAASHIPEAHAGTRFATWGHSQGGHASLSAGLLARDYAPELHLVGVAAAAPATDLTSLIVGDPRDAGAAQLTAMVMTARNRVFGAPLDPLVPPADQPHVVQLASQCFAPLLDGKTQPPDKPVPPVTYRMLALPGDTQPWRGIEAGNSTGPVPADVPVYLAQGGADTTIPPAVTERYVRRLCDAGASVRYAMFTGVSHHFIGRDAVAWIAGRFAGQTPPNDCR